MTKLIADFTSYLREVKDRQPTTIRRYLTVLEEFSKYLRHADDGQPVDLDRASKAIIISFLRQRPDGSAKLSKSVWNMRLAALRAFYRYLYQEEVIAKSPTMKIDRRKTVPNESIPLNLDEYLALVEAMACSPKMYRYRNVALVQVMFHSALRVAEVVSLDVNQVDFQGHLFLNIRTKGDKSISLPFPDLVSESLERYLQGREPNGEGALFLSNRESRISVRAVQRLFNDYGKKAGITRPVTPHLLRHSGATELANLAPLRVVQEILGHSSPEVTARYVHVASDARRLAINALGEKVTKRAKQRRKRTVRTEASSLS